MVKIKMLRKLLGLKKKEDKQQERKRVSFVSKPTILKAPGQMKSGQQSKLFWYLMEELRSIHEENKDLIYLIKRNHTKAEIEDRGYCTRGFERSIPQNSSKVSRRRKIAYMAVFEEQDMIWNGSDDNIDSTMHLNNRGSFGRDAESLAQMYRICCQDAVKDAFERARRDEEYVQQEYDNQYQKLQLRIQGDTESETESSMEEDDDDDDETFEETLESIKLQKF